MDYLEEAGGSFIYVNVAPELAGEWLAFWHSHQPGEDPRLLPDANAGRRPLWIYDDSAPSREKRTWRTDAPDR